VKRVHPSRLFHKSRRGCLPADAQVATLSELQRTNARLYRAYLLKETLAQALDYRQPGHARRALEDWLAWASRSKLAPFVKVVYPEQKRVFASLKQSKDEVIAEMAAEMQRRDPERTKTWMCVCDGEQALQRRVRAALSGFVLVLDLLHVLSYLWKAAYVFHAEGSEEATAWVKKRLLWTLEGHVSQVIKGLRQSVTKRGLHGAKRKTLLGVANYFWNNRSHMKYHDYLAAGLPIASGAVEGACKHIVKDRMERSGMRWAEDGAEAILKLRATYLSRDFDAYWEFHVRQEQLRLHPPLSWRPLRVSA
jgi:hypothetical protein